MHLSTVGAPSRPSALPHLTQEGIGAATYSGRTTATKWLTRLEGQGLVVGERAHVPGHRVRKTVYQLTEAGWAEARRVRRQLETDVVEVSVPELDNVTMRVVDIPGFFPDQFDLTATVSLVREGRLDPARTSDIWPTTVPSLMWGDTLRRVDRIFGREQEFHALDEWIGSMSSILALTGLPGIGKTALIASWVQRQRPRAHVFWFDVQDWTSPSAFLNELAAFLTRLGRRTLSNYLSDAGKLDIGFVMRVLAHDLHDLPILVVLDNFHRASSETAKFLSGPLLRLRQLSRTKLAYVSRTVPRFLASKASRKALGARILRIGGLTLEASVLLLRAKGLAADDVTAMRVASSSRGHPILLSLAAQSGSALSAEARNFMEEEIWRGLSPAERVALEAASIFRRAAPVEALRELPGVTELALVGLETRNIVEPTVSGGLVVHDTVVDYVRTRMSDDRRQFLHAFAADFFRSRADPRERLEVLYHLLNGGQLSEAAEFLEAERDGLLESASARELAVLLESYGDSRMLQVPSITLLETLADCLRIAGNDVPALLQYQHALRRCEQSGSDKPVPRILRKIASVERYRNNYPKALGLLVEAQARLERINEPSELAQVLREMALVEEAQGNTAAARTHLNEAIDLATEASDAGTLARSLVTLGTLEASQGDLSRALDSKNEALRIAVRAGNLTEAARASISIGATLHEMRRLEEALQQYDKGLRIAQLVGNFRLSAYATMNRMAVLVDMNQQDAAASALEEAKRLIQLLEEKDTMALLEISEGQREKALGNWTRATRIWERALSTLRSVGIPYDLVRSLKLVSEAYEEHGDKLEAAGYLREALTVARKIGNPDLVAELEARLDNRVVHDLT